SALAAPFSAGAPAFACGGAGCPLALLAAGRVGASSGREPFLAAARAASEAATTGAAPSTGSAWNAPVVTAGCPRRGRPLRCRLAGRPYQPAACAPGCGKKGGYCSGKALPFSSLQ